MEPILLDNGDIKLTDRFVEYRGCFYPTSHIGSFSHSEETIYFESIAPQLSFVGVLGTPFLAATFLGFDFLADFFRTYFGWWLVSFAVVPVAVHLLRKRSEKRQVVRINFLGSATIELHFLKRELAEQVLSWLHHANGFSTNHLAPAPQHQGEMQP